MQYVAVQMAVHASPEGGGDAPPAASMPSLLADFGPAFLPGCTDASAPVTPEEIRRLQPGTWGAAEAAPAAGADGDDDDGEDDYADGDEEEEQGNGAAAPPGGHTCGGPAAAEDGSDLETALQPACFIEGAAVALEPADGCGPLRNAAGSLAGRVAVAERGGCMFVLKVRAAEAAGAAAVVVVNRGENSSQLMAMAGDESGARGGRVGWFGLVAPARRAALDAAALRCAALWMVWQ